MSDWQGQNQPSAAPTPPKKGMPGWLWAMIGAVVMLLLVGGAYGLFTMGKLAGQQAGEATSTASVVASSTVATSGAVVSAEVTETSTPSGASASGDSASSGSSGDSGGSGSSTDADSSGSSSGSSGSDSSASSADSDSSGDSDSSSSSSSEPVYRSVLKLNGNSDYTSSPIRLEPGHMKMTVWVTRTNHHPLTAKYRKNSAGYVTWWATPNAVAGQSRTTEVDVTSSSLYQFRMNCDPGAAWSLRIMWKP
jgi:hypothetical protein